MDTLLTLRRPIKDVKPRKVKVKKVSAPQSTHNSLRKKKKQMESGSAKSAPTVGLGSFVALYREACGAGREGYHNSPVSDEYSAELVRAPGSDASPNAPGPALGGGDARRPLVRVVMELEY